MWKSFTSRLLVLCLTDYLNLCVNINVDVSHDITVMLIFGMLIAKIYNCQRMNGFNCSITCIFANALS